MGRAASKAGAGGRAGACRRGAASRGATFFFCSRVDGLPPRRRPLAQHSCFLGPSRVSRARPRVRQRTLTHPSAHAIARPPVPHHGRRRAQRQRQAAGRGERGGEREARAWEKCERGGGSKGATTPPSLSAHREAAPRPTCPPPGRMSRPGAGWDRWLRVAGARPSPLPPPAPAAFVFVYVSARARLPLAERGSCGGGSPVFFLSFWGGELPTRAPQPPPAPFHMPHSRARLVATLNLGKERRRGWRGARHTAARGSGRGAKRDDRAPAPSPCGRFCFHLPHPLSLSPSPPSTH